MEAEALLLALEVGAEVMNLLIFQCTLVVHQLAEVEEEGVGVVDHLSQQMVLLVLTCQ